ncbi:hypothetical protein QWI17_22290 [Gilvimarinus sp. SDUM040013]|uniref:PD-(D/E)XK nuclease superfamily protein n=1 Tax=Gilvimarinus gilvus TaxID=3058038 RepID=A0ABU4RUI1_9GAMM|nr:hypothetical protein [Gilvimarinus sp. SDUM040013]MDO3388592.1 hypothetical protein [Gilvimarinus sp. SDUM040013]MDX6848536.1 hypothetical protein [Gilvimarinus sp. SDUM040013]
MINPAMYSSPLGSFLDESTDSIVGKLTAVHTQNLRNVATQAWISEIEILKGALKGVDTEGAYIFLEFYIPRIGRRADVVIIIKGLIFVVEFKVGAKSFFAEDVRQSHGYALDLKNFHKGSHDKLIVPMLLATHSEEINDKLFLDIR